ncbi:LacI family DNA-binding transcriptional regulator [Vagococcus acidifermentans]|uniref:HTH lacI-type domain-containing protein n=1 Tax=Vagococcus acidifermentans TaxID=564710 RepID=A0A430B366_9ENTE|nr:LacI family DNA-binding transcriptional regulator [Vagococcus acidifermentans]RSU14754.1 hypothetical protein CBF27_01905 [Vagococcus acidifermentans]
MATIKDVAKHAGVSVASVSRYMNKNGYVKKETGEKIEQAIRDLNYVPNEVARSLFQKKSKLVGVLLPDITNPYFPLLAKGIEEELNRQGFMMLLANTSDSEENLQNYLTTFIQNNVSGVITTLPVSHVPKNIKMIGVDRAYEGDFIKILADDYQGGKLIGQEILQTTYRNVLIVTSNLLMPSVNLRYQGLVDVLDKHAITHTTLQSQSFNVDRTDETVASIFKNYSAYDTIVASNDYLALKIMQYAHEHGMNIPDDIQVVGYDGIPYAEMFYPSLATVKQPIYQIGQEAAKRMSKLLNNNKDELPKTTILPVTFQKGKSLRYF